LYEPEKLIDTIGRLVLWAWLVCAVFSAFSLGVIYTFVNKINRTKKL
jgi:hypothetical protein